MTRQLGIVGTEIREEGHRIRLITHLYQPHCGKQPANDPATVRTNWFKEPRHKPMKASMALQTLRCRLTAWPLQIETADLINGVACLRWKLATVRVVLDSHDDGLSMTRAQMQTKAISPITDPGSLHPRSAATDLP